MLLVLFALTTQGARRTSLTYDEPIYIAAGYSDFATGTTLHSLITLPGSMYWRHGRCCFRRLALIRGR
jgi:hypothetical protein